KPTTRARWRCSSRRAAIIRMRGFPNMRRPMRHVRIRAAAVVVFLACVAVAPRAGWAASLDLTGTPGNNYDKANFRLWYPDGPGPLRAIVVLVPGSNGDGRPQADDPF